MPLLPESSALAGHAILLSTLIAGFWHSCGSVKAGRKEVLLMRAITAVDWHVNVWPEQINRPQIYQNRQ